MELELLIYCPAGCGPVPVAVSGQLVKSVDLKTYGISRLTLEIRSSYIIFITTAFTIFIYGGNCNNIEIKVKSLFTP